MEAPEVAFAVHNELGEGPIWDAQQRLLLWVDIIRGQVWRCDPAVGKPESFEIGQPVGCLALRQQGGLILAVRDGIGLWDFESRHLKLTAIPAGHIPERRFNDGRVDRAGRFWAGTFSPEGKASLYRYDADLKLHPMQGGITVSNGIGWSPDNKVMYYTDSDRRVIYAYDFDFATGSISNRRSFVQRHDGSGVPDGLAVDSQGFVWSAQWDGWCITRYAPDGQVERVIKMPVQRPTSLAFCGADLKTIYITSARTGLTEAQLAQQPLAGHIFRLESEVAGLPEASFAG